MSIPGDKFFDAMQDVSSWLAEENINTSNFRYSRERSGEIKFCINFLLATEADRFAARFAGHVLPADRPVD